jgi:hypothetical protein
MWRVVVLVGAALVALACRKPFGRLFVWAVTLLGVNWRGLRHPDRVNFTMTLLLGLVGAGLAWQANTLTEKANAILQKQDAYFEEERAKRAVFQISRPSVFSGGPEEYQLWVTNTGRKPARGFWYLGIPKRLQSTAIVLGAPGVREVEVNVNADISDNPFDSPHDSHFFDDYDLRKFEFEEELMPMDRRLGGAVAITHGAGDGTLFARGFRWFTQTADARYPDTGTEYILLLRQSENWVRYGSRELQRALQGYIDNPADNSWLKY